MITVSGSSAWTQCPLKNLFQNIEKGDSSPAQKLGTDAHSVIEAILKGLPIPLTTELAPLFCTPIIGLYYKKEVPIESREDLLRLEAKYEKVVQISPVTALCVHPEPEDESWSNEVSMCEFINKKMFGKELLFIENRMEYKMEYRGEEILLSGKPDAYTANCSLIVDWKTASKTPSENRYETAHYYTQQTFYRWLWCKSHDVPVTPGLCCLAYLVKTRVPKFVPVGFEITADMLQCIEKIVYKTLDYIIAYKSTGEVPMPNWNMFCTSCFSRETCKKHYPMIPETLLGYTSIYHMAK